MEKKTVKKVVRKSVGEKVTRESSVPVRSQLAHMLVRPRVTEKASLLSSQHIYAFEVSQRATKKDIARAVLAFYGVTPIKVRIVPVPAKNVFVRGKWGTKKSGKKAYVRLKKGDTITIS
ncbi:MAG: 50S ribosomal protein L23 [Patescibacteria group bacterium]